MCGADLPLETFLYIPLANSLSAPRVEENSGQYSAMAWPERDPGAATYQVRGWP